MLKFKLEFLVLGIVTADIFGPSTIYAAKATLPDLGKHEIQVLWCSREKDSGIFLSALVGWVGWVWPQNLWNITTEFLQGPLVFRIS